jgi:hypothetical protein
MSNVKRGVSAMDKLKLNELKALCRQKGLKVGGNKPDLLLRLQNHNSAAAAPSQTGAPKAAVPKAAVPKAAVPKGAVPKGAVPKGAVPKAAVPKAAVPMRKRAVAPAVPKPPSVSDIHNARVILQEIRDGGGASSVLFQLLGPAAVSSLLQVVGEDSEEEDFDDGEPEHWNYAEAYANAYGSSYGYFGMPGMPFFG